MIFAGPVMNFFLAAVFIAILAGTVGFSRVDESSTVIGEVLPERPAAAAGLQSDDRVLRIDGAAVGSWADMVAIIQRSAERPLRFEVARGEEVVSLTVTPALDGGTGRIGVGPKPQTIRLGAVAAVGAGFAAAAEMTARQAGLLWGIVVGSEEELPKSARDGLEALSSQVALALESAELTEEVLRRQSEARFSSLVQNSSDVVMVVVRELRLLLGLLVVLFMTAETWRYVGRLTGPRLAAVVLALFGASMLVQYTSLPARASPVTLPRPLARSSGGPPLQGTLTSDAL